MTKSTKKNVTSNVGRPIIIAGVFVILAGVLFHLQGRALVGPASSFMYANPQWISNGQWIALVGLGVLAAGLVILKKKIIKR